MIQHSPGTYPMRVNSQIPKQELSIGIQVRILSGKHRDKRGCIETSVWDSKNHTWLYYIKNKRDNLGEYPAEELW